MIPKKIHYCWLSGEPYPELVKKCLASWSKSLPDYELIIWDKQKINVDKHLWVKQAIECRKYAFAADYIRLYALYKEGGVYLDSDVEVLKSLDSFLKNRSFIGTETSGDLEPAIIGGQKGCDWIGNCLTYYNGRQFVDRLGKMDTRPLPSILNDFFKSEYNIEFSAQTITTFDNPSITIFPTDYFSPKSLHTGRIIKTKNTVAIHHFDGSWLEKDRKYKIKVFLHRVFIQLLGQSLHNRIVNTIRKTYGSF